MTYPSLAINDGASVASSSPRRTSVSRDLSRARACRRSEPTAPRFRSPAAPSAHRRQEQTYAGHALTAARSTLLVGRVTRASGWSNCPGSRRRSVAAPVGPQGSILLDMQYGGRLSPEALRRHDAAVEERIRATAGVLPLYGLGEWSGLRMIVIGSGRAAFWSPWVSPTGHGAVTGRRCRSSRR